MSVIIPTSREQYQANFTKVLAGLNPAQLEAVQQIEGPVLALAGPGTGKTHILSARIGQILLTTDTQAFNVLCLTFTDAAVHAMRQRLLSFIGPEAHRVHIYTFHSFCNKVIQENLETFGRHELEPLSDLERIGIIRTILASLDVEHPLKIDKINAFYYEKHLTNLFRNMKAERWSVDFLKEKIALFLEELPHREELKYKRKSGENKKGDIKQAAYQKKVEQMTKLLAAVDLFPLYEAALVEHQRYDYEDMILWVVNAFEEDELLLRNYQEQYLYFLVDEFQDTNGSQNKILSQLVSYWGDNPNLFVVGDDDQSIYEFQGARVKNMTDFYDFYKQELLLVLLAQNYRSTPAILAAAQQSIEHNEIRILNQIEGLNIDKVLVSSNPAVSESTTPVRVVGYPNKLQEEIALLQRIELLHSQGVAYSKIAVIYAKHKQANNIIRLFDKRKIPYQTKRRVNILELPLVSNLRKLLQYLVLERQRPFSGEDLFYEFLYYDFVGLSPNDATKLSTWFAKRTTQALQQQQYSELPTWNETIKNEELIHSLGLENPARLIAFGKFINQAIYAQKNSSILKLFELIINRSGLIAYVQQHAQKVWLTQVLGTLFDFVRQERSKKENLSLEELLVLLQQLEENNIPLGLFQVDPAEKGIHLVTAHSSKGLEFEYVFLINGMKEYWEPKNNSTYQLTLPDTLTFSNESDGWEAARRLFYVAITRAKKELQISYFEQNQDGKAMPTSSFVDELILVPNTAIQLERTQADNATEWQLLLLTEQEEKPVLPLLPKIILDELLSNFKLSVSALNNYLFCPIGFYYEYVLRVPSFSSKEAAYGTAIHNALKRLFDAAMNKHENVLPPSSRLVELFEYELKKQSIFLSPTVYQDRLLLGRRQLPKYYAQRVSTWNIQLQEEVIMTEKAFKNTALETIPITGTVDKMAVKESPTGKYIHLVDYKTGKLKKERLNRPTTANPHGGVYWRQLVFYKLLVESSKQFVQPIRTAAIDYLTPDAQGQFPTKTLTFVPQDTIQLQALIKETYQKIRQHEFEVGCNKPTCKWCDFANRNLIPDSFANPLTEDLDDK